MLENETNGVNPEGTGVVTPTTPNPEAETSAEVITPTPVENNVDANKLQEQIKNLNTALKQERELGKTKTQELEQKLSSTQEMLDKLKGVFAPEKQPEETPVQSGLTLEQVQELIEEREARKAEEAKKENHAKTIQQEIAELEKEWDGSNGKPKYDDKKVLEWQEKNAKLYLTPKEAFQIMNRDSLIDWELKNRMTNRPNVVNVETPGGTPEPRSPQPVNPSDITDLRKAVLEAIELEMTSVNDN